MKRASALVDCIAHIQSLFLAVRCAWLLPSPIVAVLPGLVFIATCCFCPSLSSCSSHAALSAGCLYCCTLVLWTCMHACVLALWVLASCKYIECQACTTRAVSRLLLCLGITLHKTGSCHTRLLSKLVCPIGHCQRCLGSSGPAWSLATEVVSGCQGSAPTSPLLLTSDYSIWQITSGAGDRLGCPRGPAAITIKCHLLCLLFGMLISWDCRSSKNCWCWC